MSNNFKLMMNCSFIQKKIPHLPHPPPPIGGALGPPPCVILPIRLLPPGGPGGLQKQEMKGKEKGHNGMK